MVDSPVTIAIPRLRQANTVVAVRRHIKVKEATVKVHKTGRSNSTPGTGHRLALVDTADKATVEPRLADMANKLDMEVRPKATMADLAITTTISTTR